MANNTTCLSIKALYNFGLVPVNTTIIKDNGYFDLYTKDGKLACCDGEQVEIISHNCGEYILMNNAGDEDVYFSLTDKEYQVAHFA